VGPVSPGCVIAGLRKGFAAGKIEIEYNARDPRIISPTKTDGILAKNRSQKRGMRLAKGISSVRPTAVNNKSLQTTRRGLAAYDRRYPGESQYDDSQLGRVWHPLGKTGMLLFHQTTKVYLQPDGEKSRLYPHRFC